MSDMCACGTFAIGRCQTCGAAVCGIHSEIRGEQRVCTFHEQQRQRDALQDSADARNAQGAALDALLAQVDTIDGLREVLDGYEALHHHQPAPALLAPILLRTIRRLDRPADTDLVSCVCTERVSMSAGGASRHARYQWGERRPGWKLRWGTSMHRFAVIDDNAGLWFERSAPQPGRPWEGPRSVEVTVAMPTGQRGQRRKLGDSAFAVTPEFPPYLEALDVTSVRG